MDQKLSSPSKITALHPVGINEDLREDYRLSMIELEGVITIIERHKRDHRALEPETKKQIVSTLQDIHSDLEIIVEFSDVADLSEEIEKIKNSQSTLAELPVRRASSESQIMRKHRILRQTREATRGIDVPLSDVLISTGRELATQFAGAGKHAGNSASKKLLKKAKAELRRHGDPETPIEISISSLSAYFRGSFNKVILVSGGIKKAVK